MTNDITTKRFATVSEVSAFFGNKTDDRTVRRAIEAGEIPSVRLGTKTLVPVAYLLTLASASESGPPTVAAPAINEDAIRVAVGTLRGVLSALEGLLSIASGINDPHEAGSSGVVAGHELLSIDQRGDEQSPRGSTDAA